MKSIITTVLFSVLSLNLYAASWENKDVAETLYAKLNSNIEIKTFHMKKKKNSEYFINSLKQLTYRTFWKEGVVQGSVDIEEIPLQDLEFILDREMSDLSMTQLQENLTMKDFNFYLGNHEQGDLFCISLIIFDWTNKDAALYTECN